MSITEYRRWFLDAYHRVNLVERSLSRIEAPLSAGEYAALLLLLGEKEIRSSDIAARLGVGKSKASRYLSLLEKAGLVERLIGYVDKREKLFIITEKGLACVADADRALRPWRL